MRSGVNFDLGALVNSSESIGSVSLLQIGVIYFVMRILGKYAGAFLGCAMVGKEKCIRNYLGLALVPQAGVAIGLAAMGARTLGGETGDVLETIILASSVLYELKAFALPLQVLLQQAGGHCGAAVGGGRTAENRGGAAHRAHPEDTGGAAQA